MRPLARRGSVILDHLPHLRAKLSWVYYPHSNDEWEAFSTLPNSEIFFNEYISDRSWRDADGVGRLQNSFTSLSPKWWSARKFRWSPEKCGILGNEPQKMR
ncbi:hypothetical protein TNCV_1380271 [Trichonephila clavipes]|nr:hypothetical protein TNCV_1380271 [Trichonephila clavipes]